MYLPIIGCTWNRRNAPRKTVAAKRIEKPDTQFLGLSVVGSSVSFISGLEWDSDSGRLWRGI